MLKNHDYTVWYSLHCWSTSLLIHRRLFAFVMLSITSLTEAAEVKIFCFPVFKFYCSCFLGVVSVLHFGTSVKPYYSELCYSFSVAMPGLPLPVVVTMFLALNIQSVCQNSNVLPVDQEINARNK